jgi:hypothetical protein
LSCHGRDHVIAVDNRHPYSRQQHAGLDGRASWKQWLRLTIAPRNLVDNSGLWQVLGNTTQRPACFAGRQDHGIPERELVNSRVPRVPTKPTFQPWASEGTDTPWFRESSGFSGWIEYAVRKPACHNLPGVTESQNGVVDVRGARSQRSCDGS